MKKKISIVTILAITIIVCAMVADIGFPQNGAKAALSSALFGNTEIGTITVQSQADAQSISYFTCATSGPVNDIMAYISGVWTGNCMAALYAVSGGLPGALLAQSNPVSIGTTFSWVDFHLQTPYNVTAGKTYGLAIMGDIAVNVMEVPDSGQRDDNCYYSYTVGFSNPFGIVWNTDWNGAMSIYAASSSVEYVYGSAGYVVLNLPPSPACNKTNIRIGFMQTTSQSTKGVENVLDVRVWVNSSHSFGGIGYLDNNPVAVTSLTKMFAGVLSLKVVQLGATDLQIWKENGATIVNLTKSVNIQWSDPAPQTYKDLNFTLPPMTLKFVQTGDVFENSVTNTLYPSMWNVTATSSYAPGWASVLIPAWTGSGAIPTDAILTTKNSLVAVPP